MNEQKPKTCCGFGHREVINNITDKLDCSVLDAAKQGCTLFYTGAMGEFDDLFSSAVKKAKMIYPDIKLICVKPYMTNDINECGDYLYTLYDDIIIPYELMGIHFKSAITKRNQWIISKSDIVIIYSIRNYGGAYAAYKYARSHNKMIISLGE